MRATDSSEIVGQAKLRINECVGNLSYEDQKHPHHWGAQQSMEESGWCPQNQARVFRTLLQKMDCIISH